MRPNLVTIPRNLKVVQLIVFMQCNASIEWK